MLIFLQQKCRILRPSLVYLGLVGSIWVYMGLPWSTWIYFSLLGSTWVHPSVISIFWIHTIRGVEYVGTGEPGSQALFFARHFLRIS